ncbi:MAG: hypothetical protein IPO00_09245 [Betaproteobacteria bacterium]|nr:hypothetical protein [Betaproteobacteria bacterium]
MSRLAIKGGIVGRDDVAALDRNIPVSNERAAVAGEGTGNGGGGLRVSRPVVLLLERKPLFVVRPAVRKQLLASLASRMMSLPAVPRGCRLRCW